MARRDRQGNGLHYCPSCGAIVAEDARACYLCGAALHELWIVSLVRNIRSRLRRLDLDWSTLLTKSSETRCPGCGSLVESTAQVCLLCGANLRGRRRRIWTLATYLLPDLLLFALVIVAASLLGVGGVRAVRWWSRAKPPAPSATPVPASPTTYAPLISAGPSVATGATPRPTSAATRVPADAAPEALVQSAPPSPKPLLLSPSLVAPSVTRAAPSATPLLPSSTPAASPAATDTPTAVPTPAPTSTPQVHIVSQGDTPNGIAEEYGVDLNALMAANPGLEPRRLQIGQKVVIPGLGSVGGGEPAVASQLVTHTVQSGETLSEIAVQYATTLNDIYALNPNVSPNYLQPGHVLSIRPGPPTPTATATSTPTATPLPYPPPSLLWPTEGQEFQGADAQVLLQWTSVGILDEDTWYVVRVVHADQETEEWTKVPSWRVPRSMRPPSDDPSDFQWEVIVRRRDGESDTGEPISPPSDTRTFLWH